MSNNLFRDVSPPRINSSKFLHFFNDEEEEAGKVEDKDEEEDEDEDQYNDF